MSVYDKEKRKYNLMVLLQQVTASEKWYEEGRDSKNQVNLLQYRPQTSIM